MDDPLLTAAAEKLAAELPRYDDVARGHCAVDGYGYAITAGPLADVRPPAAGHLTYTESLILQALNAADGPLTGPQLVEEIARVTDEPCSYGYLRKLLSDLRDRGIVESLGSGRGYRALCY